MTTSSRGVLRRVALLGLLSITLACGGASESEVDETGPTLYSVRGVIRQVRPAIDGKTQLSILHEAIPNFIGINGDVVGMKSMTMPFTVAESVDLSELGPGSRIQFELVVDWNRTNPGLITSIATLPEDVVLSFEAVD